VPRLDAVSSVEIRPTGVHLHKIAQTTPEIDGLTMTKLLRACLVGVALLLISVSITWASDRSITLRLGTGSSLALEKPFKTVLIGDQSVVNVRTQNDRSVILEPLSLGATNIIFVDERSIAITNVGILVCNAGAIRITYQVEPDCE
jgi:Flp pilus assembly secretin CpaC